MPRSSKSQIRHYQCHTYIDLYAQLQVEAVEPLELECLLLRPATVIPTPTPSITPQEPSLGLLSLATFNQHGPSSPPSHLFSQPSHLHHHSFPLYHYSHCHSNHHSQHSSDHHSQNSCNHYHHSQHSCHHNHHHSHTSSHHDQTSSHTHSQHSYFPQTLTVLTRTPRPPLICPPTPFLLGHSHKKLTNH
ncbi:hypothetical protein FKM82_005734 [Ascaphus truei]